jgi:hypothetical protein
MAVFLSEIHARKIDLYITASSGWDPKMGFKVLSWAGHEVTPMNDTITLHGAPVELNSDIGRQFVIDCVRAAEGLITDKELAEIYEISPADWGNIAKDVALGRAIRAERDRRVRTGIAAREAASKHFVKAPTILDKIMSDEQSNARHRIEAIRELRQTAIPENQNTQPQSDRFIIQINLGADVEVYNKSIAINANDVPPDEQPKLTATKQPKLTIISNDGFESDE